MENPRRSFIGSEDQAVLILGTFILFATFAGYLWSSFSSISDQAANLRNKLVVEEKAPVKSIAWHRTSADLEALHASKEPFGSTLKKLSGKPGSWSSNPLRGMQLSESAATKIRNAEEETYRAKSGESDVREKQALLQYEVAKGANFTDESKNAAAIAAVQDWKIAVAQAISSKKKYSTESFSKWMHLILLFLLFLMLFGMAQYMRGYSFSNFAMGFLAVFALGFLSYLIAGQASIRNLGIGYAAWSILLGLIISNTVGTPQWVRGALTTELYIKTGLVLLGAEILFGKILAIGLPGIFVAWVVTPIVLITTYWFGQRILKIPSRTLNITISADMSVCGVSAAVATAAASKASKEELTLAIGLSMVFTSVMMIVLPLVINALDLPEILGGAWIGGTIDATGAVVAAGAFLGDDALNVAATIKMIQNILIGIIAFGVAIYFSKMEGAAQKVEVGWGEIWRRFPKFILGFIGASIIFSIIYLSMNPDVAYSVLDQGVLGGFTKNIRGWLFCLAFVSIGLSTNFRELKKHFSGGRPLILYLCGQTFNLALTLLMAYIMFYLVFPDITANI